MKHTVLKICSIIDVVATAVVVSVERGAVFRGAKTTMARPVAWSGFREMKPHLPLATGLSNCAKQPSVVK